MMKEETTAAAHAESGGVQEDLIRISVTRLLRAIGENPTREGLVDTPDRVARFWKSFIEYDPGKIGTTFEAKGQGQLVVLRVNDVWSMCEHHLLPFSMDVVVGYQVKDKYLGASKVARVCYKYAHRLQIQERFLNQVADEIAEITGQSSVAAYAIGRHTCMQCRGIENTGSLGTSVKRGYFLGNPYLYQEFMFLAKEGGK